MDEEKKRESKQFFSSVIQALSRKSVYVIVIRSVQINIANELGFFSSFLPSFSYFRVLSIFNLVIKMNICSFC